MVRVRFGGMAFAAIPILLLVGVRADTPDAPEPAIRAAAGAMTQPGAGPVPPPRPPSVPSSCSAKRYAEPRARGPGPGAFTVATFNVLFKNVNLDAVIGTLRKADADFVALQETNAGSAAAIRKHLGRDYPHMRFHNRRHGSGMAILSKVPLRKVRFLPRKHGMHPTYIAQVQFRGRVLQLANVHLCPTLLPRRRNLKAWLIEYARTDGIRGKETAYICSQLAKDLPAIFLGDLNCPGSMNGSARAHLAKKGFIDSFAAVHDEPNGHPTFQALGKGPVWKFRLDYIFHDKEFRTLDSKVIPSAGSDHRLVISTLKWAAEPASQPAGPPVSCMGLRFGATEVVYVVDCTGSMIETFEAVRKGVAASINALGPGQKFGLICFGGGAPALVRRSTLRVPTPQNKAAAVEALKNTRCRGKGGPEQAIERAMQALLKNPRRVAKAVVLIGDGIYPDNAALLRRVRVLNLEQTVPVHMILVGMKDHPPDADDVQFMKDLAKQTGGRFLRATLP